MWSVRQDELHGAPGQRWTFAESSSSNPLDARGVIDGWRNDARFRDGFNDLLAAAPYHKLRWEVCPLTAATLDRPFECVVLPSPELAESGDPGSFSEYFREAGSDIASFANLGGDAWLLVPYPQSAPAAYGHLAAFARAAPAAQRDALWRTVGDALAARVGDMPIWLNTAGAGVPWLHVRLDQRPKYYRHTPYRVAGK